MLVLSFTSGFRSRNLESFYRALTVKSQKESLHSEVGAHLMVRDKGTFIVINGPIIGISTGKMRHLCHNAPYQSLCGLRARETRTYLYRDLIFDLSNFIKIRR